MSIENLTDNSQVIREEFPVFTISKEKFDSLLNHWFENGELKYPVSPILISVFVYIYRFEEINIENMSRDLGILPLEIESIIRFLEKNNFIKRN